MKKESKSQLQPSQGRTDRETSDEESTSEDDLFADKHVHRKSLTVTHMMQDLSKTEESDKAKVLHTLSEAIKHCQEEEHLLHQALEHQHMEETLLRQALANSKGASSKGASGDKPVYLPPSNKKSFLLLVLGGVFVGLFSIAVEFWTRSETSQPQHRDFETRKTSWVRPNAGEAEFSTPHGNGVQPKPNNGHLEDESVTVPQQDLMPEFPVTFSVLFNGGGKSTKAIHSSSAEWNGLDEMIQSVCSDLPEVQNIAHEDNSTLARICDPREGARVFTETGKRVFSFVELTNGTQLFMVPQGLHFVYPLFEVGNEIFPEMRSPIPDRPIRLKQLSLSPRVFQIENFITDEEIDAILEHNNDLVKPSEVGFSGWRDSTRTSSTAWDFNSWAARRVRRRAFDLVRIGFDNEMADALQVLRYNTSEWYKPHTDWFDETAYEGNDPTVQNGTNRFATVFVYLSSVEEGGHTVFPLSTTHEGYNGEQIVHPGTDRTPGYIATNDAKWACNTSSTALRSGTVRGGALLFYNQGPDSSLDKYSLHGGCPVLKGVKWSANVWLWNRPKPGKERAKDQKPAPDHQSIQLRFHNNREEAVNLFWDDGTEAMVYQVQIGPGEYSPMTTYHGHRFVARSSVSNETVFEFIARDKYKGQQYVAEIP